MSACVQCLFVRSFGLPSPTIFQVCCSTWNSSLNGAELEDHLVLANKMGGGMVFQSPDAKPARIFLRTILDGKALLATCSLTLPRGGATEADVAAAAAAATSAAAAALGVDSAAAEFAALPSSSLSLQTLPNAAELFASALRRVGRLWFHPLAGAQDQTEPPQLTQAVALNDSVNVSLASLSSVIGAAAASQVPHEPVAAAAAAASAAASAAWSIPATPFAAAPSAPTPFGCVGPSSHIAWPATLSVSNLFAHSRPQPVKSRSTKLREMQERAPLQLTLLQFVQICSVPIESSDRTPAIPSVVLCNQPRRERPPSDKMPAPRSTALTAKAGMGSSSAPLQRKKSTGVRAAIEQDQQPRDNSCAAAPPAVEESSEGSLLLLGAAAAAGMQDGDVSPPNEESEAPDSNAELNEAEHEAPADAASSTTPVQPQLPAAEPAVPAAATPPCTPIAAAVPQSPDSLPSSSPPSEAALSPAPVAAPSPSPKVVIAVTLEELVEFQRFKAAQLAAATGAVTTAAASSSPSPSAWCLVPGASSVQPYASLPITPRSGYLHSVSLNGFSLPITGVHSLTGVAPVPLVPPSNFALRLDPAPINSSSQPVSAPPIEVNSN